MKKMDIINELYEKSGFNVAELLQEFEENYQYNIRLVYKNIYKQNNLIIINVIDEITECPFELKFNEKTKKLEIY